MCGLRFIEASLALGMGRELVRNLADLIAAQARPEAKDRVADVLRFVQSHMHLLQKDPWQTIRATSHLAHARAQHAWFLVLARCQPQHSRC